MRKGPLRFSPISNLRLKKPAHFLHHGEQGAPPYGHCPLFLPFFLDDGFTKSPLSDFCIVNDAADVLDG